MFIVDGPETTSLVIDCDTCVSQHTEVCGDCLVSFVCDSQPQEGRRHLDGVVVDVAEFRAMRRLGDAGLVPHLRHAPRAG